MQFYIFVIAVVYFRCKMYVFFLLYFFEKSSVVRLVFGLVLYVVQEFNFYLTDSPDPPAIFGYLEGTAIHAGKLQRLTCISHGGNPLPELKWFKNGDEVKTYYFIFF